MASLLPPKKADLEPLPEIIDDAKYEETDIVDVRSRSFPASAHFFDQEFPSQFGEGDEDDWIEFNRLAISRSRCAVAIDGLSAVHQVLLREQEKTVRSNTTRDNAESLYDSVVRSPMYW